MNIDKVFKIFRALADSGLIVIVLATMSDGMSDNVAINKCDH
jgi:hypothetical protein